MGNLPIAPDAIPPASRPGTTAESAEDQGEDFLDATKVYLECLSRGVDPPPLLVAAWNRFYGFYAPRIRLFLGKRGRCKRTEMIVSRRSGKRWSPTSTISSTTLAAVAFPPG